ncbi:hypothetical protein [Staphylothermus hellenicus]|uniref:Uncharacterized protein n=1 Tax=Staphylothermus hellenicus (strain DSM 12710 / JCM 10830 / BK20S6-10-b1 / P8) TaxID=591019 RepID=D7D9Y3_STAHD|nr:hypothetical protein [Staphylothermus hellenicus]ADI32579.1 hypothetical protein Shell_1491 [Staphylothermus hellenicus DSM 12710]
MNKHPALNIISTDMKSRNIKNVLKRIKPLTKNKISLYIIFENNAKYIVLAYDKPVTKYYKRKTIDYLSGLTVNLKEASILHGNKVFIRIYWDGTYFRIKTIDSPLIIKIVADINNNLLEYFMV